MTWATAVLDPTHEAVGLPSLIPAVRFRSIIERRWIRRGRTRSELALRSGVSSRTIEALMRGDRQSVRFSVADKLVCAIDVWLWRTSSERGGLADLYGVDESPPLEEAA